MDDLGSLFSVGLTNFPASRILSSFCSAFRSCQWSSRGTYGHVPSFFVSHLGACQGLWVSRGHLMFPVLFQVTQERECVFLRYRKISEGFLIVYQDW